MEVRIFPSKLQEKITQRHCLSYDIWGKSIESHSNDKAIELTEIRDSQSTLEVAVRTGLAFYEIVTRNPNGSNQGIDLSKGMPEKTTKRLSKLSDSNCSLDIRTTFDLSIEDESIDILVNNYMLDP